MSSDDHQKIHIVSGKGGVGKSTVAAALSKRLSKEGRNVLLVELSDSSYLGPSLNIQGVSFEPKVIEDRWSLSTWDPESCLRDYILHLVKVEQVYRMFFENKVMRSFIDVAPGLKELAILGKATSGVRHVGPKLDYDDVVIDSFSTGHTLALLKAPFAMKEVVSRGPMGQQATSIANVLNDPNVTEYYLVATPEELPVTELIEFNQDLTNVIKPRPKVIINKWVKTNLTKGDLETEELVNGKYSDFTKYLSFKLSVQSEQRNRLKEMNIHSELPIIYDSNNYGELVERLSAEIKLETV